MPGLGGIFGRGSIGEQLFVWGLLAKLVGTLTDPGVLELSYLVSENTVNGLLAPADLAELVNRGFIDQGKANSEGAKQNLDEHRMALLTELAGQAPPPEQLAEGVRRGILDWDAAKGGMPSGRDGIRQGNLRNEWAPLVEALAVQLPSWSDALDALLQGQLGEPEAHAAYLEAGGDPRAFTWLFNTRGAAPSPVEAATMANRGIIPWTGTGPGAISYQQAFLEGPWRNKWEPSMRRLAEYLPPPRTVTALLRAQSITAAEALTLLEKEGLTPELAAAYVKDATRTKAATSKEFSAAQVEGLYGQGLIAKPAAVAMLVKLGMPTTEAELILSSTDLKKSIAATSSAVTRIRMLYLARRIESADAVKDLHTLGVSAVQASELMTVWELERLASVKVLTEAQVVAAWHGQIIDQAEATAELVHQGYTAKDAWILLSTRNGKPLPGKPS